MIYWILVSLGKMFLCLKKISAPRVLPSQWPWAHHPSLLCHLCFSSSPTLRSVDAVPWKNTKDSWGQASVLGLAACSAILFIIFFQISSTPAALVSDQRSWKNIPNPHPKVPVPTPTPCLPWCTCLASTQFESVLSAFRTQVYCTSVFSFPTKGITLKISLPFPSSSKNKS